VTLCDKSRSCEIEVWNVKSLRRIDRLQIRWFCHGSRILSQERLAKHVLLVTPTGKRPRSIPRSRAGIITSPTWLVHVLVWIQRIY